MKENMQLSFQKITHWYYSEISVENAKSSSIVNFPMHLCDQSLTSRVQDTQSLWNHWYHQYVGTSTKPIIQTTNTGRLTLVAFFMNLALSFSMSCQDLIGVFSSSPTTIPGPWVAGPPMKAMMRAPVLGKEHYKRREIIHKHKALETL